MSHSKITVNTNSNDQQSNEYFYQNKSSGIDDTAAAAASTILRVNIKPDLNDYNNEVKKRSSSLNTARVGGISSNGGLVSSNILEETTTYKYINSKRPRRLSVDSTRQANSTIFPIRNTTSTNQYYNTSQAAFYPTWDDWKRQHVHNKAAKPIVQINDTTTTTTANNEKQQNKSIFEETSTYKYSSSSKQQEAENTDEKKMKIPNQVELNRNERIKNFQHNNYNNNEKKNNDVYELQIDNKQKQQEEAEALKIEEEEKQRKEKLKQQQNNTKNVKKEGALALNTTEETQHSKKSYMFADQLMQNYFDEMENKRKTLLNNENVSLTHTLTNDALNKRASGKVDLNMKQSNIKSIKSTTLKRKDSFDSKHSSRTRLNELSDSDTEVQSRLLAKASGSIPIEYISIRRDQPTPPPVQEKKTKSISIGTNTTIERGKRIASTNTEEPQLPTYNLHLSLDSLFQKAKREASTSTDRKKLKDAFTYTDDADTDTELYRVRSEKCINIIPHQSRKANYEDYRLEFLAKSPRTLRRKEYHREHHEQHKTTKQYFDEDTDVSDNEQYVHKIQKQHAEINIDEDDKLIFGDGNSLNVQRSGSYPASRLPLVNLNENLVTTRRYVKQSKNTTFLPNQPRYELSLMPLFNQQNQQVANLMWNRQFDDMNVKFNKVFGQQRQFFNHQHHIQQQQQQQQQQQVPFIEAPIKTERYYKYSKTTNEPIPTFGEIYSRNASYNHQQQQFRQQQQQQQQYNNKPIIEMPATPNSTMRSTRRTYSYGDNAHHHQQQQQQRNGPIITQLTPTPSDINAPVTRGFSGYSSQSSRHFQTSQQQQQASSSLINAENNEQYIRKAQSCTNLEPPLQQPLLNASNNNNNNNSSSYSSYQYSSYNNNNNNKNGHADNERHFIPINVNNA